MNIPPANTMLTVREKERSKLKKIKLKFTSFLKKKKKSNGENDGAHARTRPLEEPARHRKTDGLLRSNLATRAKERCTTS